MASVSRQGSKEWKFTRPDPANSSAQYFRTDMRTIAGQQADYNLPWRDDLYLAYPSVDAPNWSTFMEHVGRLNEDSDEDTYYKVVYVVRRAHKVYAEEMIDPLIDDVGKEQCARSAVDFDHAMKTRGVPRPEVIVTSPLVRALETTKLGVACLNPTVRPVVLEGLREGLDGESKNKRRSKNLIERDFADFNTGNVDANDSLGSQYEECKEPYEPLWLRVKDSFAYVFEHFPDALVIALVSHCHVVQTIQREITGFDLKEEDRMDKVEFYVGEAGAYAIIVKGECRGFHEEESSLHNG